MIETKQSSSDGIVPEEEKTNNNKKNQPFVLRLVKLILTFIIVTALFVVTYFVLTEMERQSSLPMTYFSTGIKGNIEKTIKNGGDLDIVKHIYVTRELKTKKFAIPFFTKYESSYPEPTALSVILKDIKKDHYLEGKIDTLFISKLDIISTANEQINPFDKLALNQKFMFENVRQKLDTTYSVVQEDINRIADEMNNKNLLVDEYLEKSNLSYWISIVALVFTIGLSLVQIYQNRNKESWSKNNINTRIQTLYDEYKAFRENVDKSK